MARFSNALLAIILTIVGLCYVEACEKQCRSDPVSILAKRYDTLIEHQANQIKSPRARNAVLARKPEILSKLTGRNKVIDKTIFDKFRGTCSKAGMGLRSPHELCGSAKSIACFAPWGHQDGVLDSVHTAVVKLLGQIYGGARYGNEVRENMVKGVRDYCPQNCQDWVKPFQDVMLSWERREHPREYKVTPNCLELGKGGI